MPVFPEEWQAWVSAGTTRNYILNDPLLDWLHLYGRALDFIPRQEQKDYQPALDFTQFIFERARAFEAGILTLIQRRYQVVTVAGDHREITQFNKAVETYEAMDRGVPVLYQGVLWDAHHQTYGAPDFLVRSDVLRELFPSAVTEDEAAVPAPGLNGDPWHYRVVDVKYATLNLNAPGTELANGGGKPAYKAQLFLYNRMLGRLQGLLPSVSYLLGRGWEREEKRVPYRGTSAFDLLAPVPQNGNLARNLTIQDAVEKAIAWVRHVRTEGRCWSVLPSPTVPELYPNMNNQNDEGLMVDTGPEDLGHSDGGYDPPDHWTSAKKWLADELGELTLLWQVGVPGRKLAHAKGIYRWDTPGLTPQDVDIQGPATAPSLRRLLQVNTGDPKTLVLPERVEAARTEWHPVPAVEFFVDFEFCSDLNDDFTRLPEKGGQPLIFMVGCGHMEDGTWQFSSFTAERLTEAEELRIIEEWMDHMATITASLAPGGPQPRVIHWSNAEVMALESAYNSMRTRHGKSDGWPGLNWYDVLSNVVRKEPVVVRGSLGFGLKALANALHSQGLIETSWEDSPIDGLGAMVGAWQCDEEAEQRGIAMTSLPLMAEIIRYNEIDCKVMMEIVRYLRNNH